MTVTSAQDWKKSVGTPLDLPSGNTALVRAPGMQLFLKSGKIPNVLMKSVTAAIDKGKAPEFNDIEITEDVLVEFSNMIDDATCYCVIQPKVYPTPPDVVNPDTGEITPGKRDDELLYVDEVDMDDKTFIFQFAVGGTRDLERFREQQAEGLALVSTGQ